MRSQDYTVGVICALEIEYVAACELLDVEHSKDEAPVLETPRDDNIYTFGRIGEHNIIIACLPKGKYGIASAATVAKDMLRSFEAIRFGLFVGIGGGAPSEKHDIRLGDVVVSSPVGNRGGVVHYDFGKAVQDRDLEATRSLNAPPKILLNALQKLSSDHRRKGNRIKQTVADMINKNKKLKRDYERPPATTDRLYQASYTHAENDKPCTLSCSSSSPPLILRELRGVDDNDSKVHYGLIASADKVMKDALLRDFLVRKHDVLCFETEAAGLMDDFPCVVIRGICDYSDSHKNDIWQSHTAAVAAAYAKELLYVIPSKQITDTAPPVKKAVEKKSILGASVPGTRVSFFVHRETILEEMDKLLLNDSGERIVVLLGMGGSGKTQLALEYCRTAEAESKFSSVIWIDASSPTSVEHSFSSIASRVIGASEKDMDMERSRAVINEALRKESGKWLAIFDNFDNPGCFEKHDIRYYIPKAEKGTILFTSRHTDSERLGSVIKIAGMSEEQSLSLLLRQSSFSAEERLQGLEVAVELGYLALALDQAGAYIRSRNLPLRSFISHYKRRRERILKEVPSLWEYRRQLNTSEKATSLNAFVTWELSFELVDGNEREKRAKEHFLTLAAFFNEKSISQCYFQYYCDSVSPEWMYIFQTNKKWDEYEFRDVVAEFWKLSLLQKPEQDFDEVKLSLHPIIRDWLKLRRDQEQQHSFAKEFIALLNDYLRRFEYGDLDLQTRAETLLHIDACMQNNEAALEEVSRLTSKNYVNPTYGFANYYSNAGRWNEAEILFNRALTYCRSTHEVTRIPRIEIMKSLAIIYMNKGSTSKAKKLFEEVAIVEEELLGPRHPDTLRSRWSLARCGLNEGKYNEAEEVMEEILVAQKLELGSEHDDMLNTMLDLAWIYLKQCQYTKAEDSMETLVRLRRKVSGGEHVQTLASMQWLAQVYHEQSKYHEAEELLKHVLSCRERLMPIHPDTILTVEELANVYVKQGRCGEAEDLYKKALKGNQAFGLDSLASLWTMQNLARLYKMVGRYDEAEALFQQSLAGQKDLHGPRHPGTLKTMCGLAATFNEQGRYKEAESLYKQALADQEVMGSNHPDTVAEIYNLALLYDRQKRFEEAETLYKQAVTGYEETLGLNHLRTLDTMHNLACVYSDQQRFEEARKLCKRAFAGWKEAPGLEHPNTLNSARLMVYVFERLGHTDEANSLRVEFSIT